MDWKLHMDISYPVSDPDLELRSIDLLLIQYFADGSSLVEEIIEAGVVPRLVKLLSSNKVPQLQAVIDANIFSHIIQVSQNGEIDFKKEAAWDISNAASSSSPEQIRYLVDQGCIRPLCDALILREPDLLYACLNGLEMGEMERKKSGSNPYTEMIEECEGLDKLENLQEFDNNDDIYDKTIELLEGYWNEEFNEGECESPKQLNWWRNVWSLVDPTDISSSKRYTSKRHLFIQVLDFLWSTEFFSLYVTM